MVWNASWSSKTRDNPSIDRDPTQDLPQTPPAPVVSFQAVYAQYFQFVWASAQRLGVTLDAIDDVVQDVFIVVHSKHHTLDRADAIRSWLYGVVRRITLAHHRTRRSKAELDVGDDFESPLPSPFERTIQNAAIELLAKLLAGFDERKLEVFILVELEQMTASEAAEALEIPLNTVYSRLRAARKEFDAARARHDARRHLRS